MVGPAIKTNTKNMIDRRSLQLWCEGHWTQCSSCHWAVEICYIQRVIFLSVFFRLSSNIMQSDCRYFLSICSESEGKVKATVIQTRMNTSQHYKIRSRNHINLCQQNLQIGIPLIDMFSSLLFLLIVKLEHLFLSQLPPWSLCLAGRQFQIEFFRNRWWKLLCSRTSRI